MYLVRNKRTKDFIDNNSDWTLVRSFAKRFTSKDEAQKFIDKHQTKNDDPYMEIVSEGVQKHLKEYLKEATMSDIPHEIDDQIHKLKDMRFELEETQKNWDLAGMDTTPLSNIINEINKLIEVMYSKGANLANQTIKESNKMKSFKQFLKESVSDIPSDLRDLVNKHCGMSKFTKEIYDASHKDLNELEMKSSDIKSGKKISTADIDKIANDGIYLVVDLGADGMLLAGKGMWNGVYDGKKRFNDVYANGRNYGVDSSKNIATVLNTDKFKDAKYWLIDLSKAKSTEDLRKERQEAQKGIIQRYDGWYGTKDKSGYIVDRHKYNEMLQKLKMEGNDYVNQLSEISARLFKAMANPKAKEHSYDIGKAIDAIQTATRESVNKYSDATYVKDKIKKADDAVKIVEKYAE